MIVLDTHSWVWWVSGDSRLSAAAHDAITEAAAESKLHISAISAWEVALLVAKGRLELTIDVSDWISHSEALPFLRFIPVDHRLAVRSVQLNEYLHNDPADRIIIATALSIGSPIVTRDPRIRGYSAVETIW